MKKTEFKGLKAAAPLNFAQALLLTTAYLYQDKPKSPWFRPGFCHLFAFIQQELGYVPKSEIKIPLQELPQWTIKKGQKKRWGTDPSVIKAWNPIIGNKVKEFLLDDYTREGHDGDPVLSVDGINLVELLLAGQANQVVHVDEHVVSTFAQPGFVAHLRQLIREEVNEFTANDFAKELPVYGCSPTEQVA